MRKFNLFAFVSLICCFELSFAIKTGLETRTTTQSIECPNCVYGDCVDGQCLCWDGFVGPSCSAIDGICRDANNPDLPVCSGHGHCNQGKCVCDEFFLGDICEVSIVAVEVCPNNCNGAGLCVQQADGPPYCHCLDGAFGTACTRSGCQGGCGGGKCVEDEANPGRVTCDCPPGFTGAGCKKKVCPKCEHGGRCDAKSLTCICPAPYFGNDCALVKCPGDCSGHGWCNTTSGKCVCEKPYVGDDCSIDTRKCKNGCSGTNGICTKSGVCVCGAQFGGEDCSLECPEGCSLHGKCVQGVCECNEGYAGDACMSLKCPNSCSGNGECIKSLCYCNPGYAGEDCSEKLCPNQCNGHGLCVRDKCICEQALPSSSDFSPPPLSAIRLQDITYDKVISIYASAKYDRGYEGEDCGKRRCPTNCGGSSRGRCNTEYGLCECQPGYAGFRNRDCSITMCDSSQCSNHGLCLSGSCLCESGDSEGRGGWRGQYCEIPVCPDNCGEMYDPPRGHCVKGQCQCESKYYGDDCSKAACPRAKIGEESLMCSGSDHGVCINGACACKPGFSGAACQNRFCPNQCSDNGICQPDGVCKCDSLYEGEDCSQLRSGDNANPEMDRALRDSANRDKNCPNDCFHTQGRGVCVAGQCLCKQGFYFGKDCSSAYCVEGCKHGQCDTKAGTCICQEGWTGEDCSKPWCVPADCSGNGDCVIDEFGLAECNCTAPFAGPACVDVQCSSTCNERGICLNFQCFCDPRYHGAECQFDKCPDECSGRGFCHILGQDGAEDSEKEGCVCADGWIGANCSIPSCPEDCRGHGNCVPQDLRSAPPQCVCDHGYIGAACEHVLCDLDCGVGGTCWDGECHCTRWYTGALCERQICPNNCSGHGNCSLDMTVLSFAGSSEDGCFCDDGWTGLDCATPVECHLHCEHGECRARVNRTTFVVTSQCDCAPGWMGFLCEKESCPNDCSDHGWCNDPKMNPLSWNSSLPQGCFCQLGFSPPDCFKRACMPSPTCNDRGICIDGTCMCREPYAGVACEDILCHDTACQHGRCVNFTCHCDMGWIGRECDIEICPNMCSGKGRCIIGSKEEKEERFALTHLSDEDIHRKLTQENFEGCVCDRGWAGHNCSILDRCDPVRCREHGVCSEGECVCDEGWAGVHCALAKYPCGPKCTTADESHGLCVMTLVERANLFSGGKNQTVANYTDYLKLAALMESPAISSAECLCGIGYYGPRCVSSHCTPDCYDQGVCVLQNTSAGKQEASCMCFKGYVGESCQYRACDLACLNGGFCANDTCICPDAWTGPLCDIVTCPNDCTGPDHGYCNVPPNPHYTATLPRGCVCNTNWSGVDCGLISPKLACPSGCLADDYHGFCNHPSLDKYNSTYKTGCKCAPGWIGEDCATENPCGAVCAPGGASHGHCTSFQGEPRSGPKRDGKVFACVCDKGWKGPDCTIEICPGQCHQHGTCSLDLSVKVPNLQGQGCICEPGYYGAGCEHQCGVCAEDQYEIDTCSGMPPDGHDVVCGRRAETPFNLVATPIGARFVRLTWNEGPENDCKNGTWDIQQMLANIVNHEWDLTEWKAAQVEQVTPSSSSNPKIKEMELSAVVRGLYKLTHYAFRARRICSDAKADSPWGSSSEIIKTLERDTLPCGPQQCGSTLSIPHGRCILDDDGGGHCECTPPWRGSDCHSNQCEDIVALDSLCGMHGTCALDSQQQPYCSCFHPYTGINCTDLLCADSCNDHGLCVNGRCRCARGYLGDFCQNEICPSNCSGHGACVLDRQVIILGLGENNQAGCECDPGWLPPSCSQMDLCYYCKHGECVQNEGSTQCNCRGHWTGAHCDRCASGWDGEDCSENLCELSGLSATCSDHGTCVTIAEANQAEFHADLLAGMCVCQDGWGGSSCAQRTCDLPCGHGQCLDNECHCDHGWFGDNCQFNGSLCVPPNCHNHGQCLPDERSRPYCHCVEPYFGPSCADFTCSLDCSDHGKCINFKCVCDEGWTGADCSLKATIVRSTECPLECSHRAHCIVSEDPTYGTQPYCLCPPGWNLPDCSTLACLERCPGKSICNNGTCECQRGWTGDNCDIEIVQLDLSACPANCSDHGLECYSAPTHQQAQYYIDQGYESKISWGPMCICEPHFYKRDCSLEFCASSLCGPQHTCVNQKCVCKQGYIEVGKLCEPQVDNSFCPGLCTERGVCVRSSSSSSESSVIYSCICDSPYHGDSCEFPLISHPDNTSSSTSIHRIHKQNTKPHVGASNEKVERKAQHPQQETNLCENNCNGHGECIVTQSYEDSSISNHESEPSSLLELSLHVGSRATRGVCRCDVGYQPPYCTQFDETLCMVGCELRCAPFQDHGQMPVTSHHTLDDPRKIKYENIKDCMKACILECGIDPDKEKFVDI